VLHAGPAEIEPTGRRVTVGAREVDLTRLEFDLLAELAAHPRVVYTRERLLEKVWGYQSGVGGKTVDVHVANLRRKLGEDIGIVAVRGVGYKLEPVA
jgi:DNA-binding response OmpR family regulator